MNDENLIPFSQLSQRERTEIARKGAIASNKAQKERKLMREIVADMLAQKIEELDSLKNYEEIQPLICMLGNDNTLAGLMVAGQIRSAIDGNSKAFDLLTTLNDEQVSKKKEESYDELSVDELRGLLNGNKP